MGAYFGVARAGEGGGLDRLEGNEGVCMGDFGVWWLNFGLDSEAFRSMFSDLNNSIILIFIIFINYKTYFNI